MASYREALERVPMQGKTFLVKHQPRVITNRGDQGSCSYLLGLLIYQVLSFLLLLLLGVSYHLFRGGIPGLKDLSLIHI